MAKQPKLPQQSLTQELTYISSELRNLQQERQSRARARVDLLTYASSIEIPTAPQSIDDANEKRELKFVRAKFGLHHILWLEALQNIEDGKIKRLMGLMPPGSGKSIFTSVVFPTHYLGRFAKRSIIVASYGSDLPRKFGRRARSVVKQTIYQRIFNCTLSEESAAVDEWALTNGSEWMAAGILTGITGNRVDGVIWDDLIKGREQADSDVVRNKTWEAYFDDLLTRKKPHAFEVGINTRWHEDDPAGRILPPDYNGGSGMLKGQDGNDWYVLCLPAECERTDDPLGRQVGEIIWPEWFTKEHFAPFKRNARTWNALYQQRPAPDSGDFFKAEWLVPYGPQQIHRPPDRRTLTTYGASDYAVKADGGDYTVHIVVGVNPEGQVYVLDMWRAQASSDKWIETMCDMIQLWRPAGWAEETGQINAGVGPFLAKRLRERRLYIPRVQFPARVAKEIRARSIQGRIALDGLFVPIDAPWFPTFKHELMTFPAGRNDDIVDALSLIGQVLDKMIPGSSVTAPQTRQKILSTDPAICNVTLSDLFEANERKRTKNLRIA